MKRLALIMLIALGLTGSASAAPRAGPYADPTGDSNGALDISSVDVANDAANQITIRINLAGTLTSPSQNAFGVLLDTDQNGATGSPESLGADYAIGSYESDNTFDFARWTGSDWGDTPYSTVKVYSDSSGVTFSVNASELGGTKAFNFWVRSRSGDLSTGPYEDAPDSGTWSYSLQAAAPAETPVPAIQSVSMPLNALPPKAGKALSARGMQLKLTDGTLVDPDSVECSLKIAGKTVKPIAGGCKWKIPKSAKGKRAVLKVTLTYQGASTTQSFPLKVA